jgi:hypothetical protein
MFPLITSPSGAVVDPPPPETTPSSSVEPPGHNDRSSRPSGSVLCLCRPISVLSSFSTCPVPRDLLIVDLCTRISNLSFDPFCVRLHRCLSLPRSAGPTPFHFTGGIDGPLSQTRLISPCHDKASVLRKFIRMTSKGPLPSSPESDAPAVSHDIVFTQLTLHAVVSRQLIDELFDGEISDLESESDEEGWIPPTNKAVRRVTSEFQLKAYMTIADSICS